MDPADDTSEDDTSEDGTDLDPEIPPTSLPVDPPNPAEGTGGSGATTDDVPTPACAREVTEANKATVAAAIDELFVQGDISAVDRYWGEPYLQHNPIAASGVTTFRNLFSGLVSPGSSIYQLSRVIGECELVLIHGDYTSFGGPTFDMFRVEGGRLVEHWDAAAVGPGPNASGRSALDGDSVVRDVEQSGSNEALVLEFVERVLVNGAHEAIGQYVSPALIEHDPESSDGSDAYVVNLQDRAVTYRQVHHAIGDGNLVFVLSEGAVGATDVAHYDLFRVEDTLIVEHWNGRRNVPASTQSGLGIF
jgi:predicted SnoaL-like aldol condensation-catalyzing enzyme